MHGYIDFGNGLLSETGEEAKRALVFMIVAINGSWKLPVAYFLVNSVKSQQKATLVEECIKKAEMCNIKIV